MKLLKSLLVASMLILSSASVSAQCTFRNTAFKSGEFLSYNLYYNWKFVWVKAGTASMSVIQSTHQGKPAYRGSLITRGNQKVDDFFVLRDTLLCYSGTDMAPLYFRKGAREGKRYTVDEVFYSYANGKCNLHQHRLQNDGAHVWKKASYDDCVFDMMNIFLRARNFDPANWKKGYIVKFPIADGKSRTPAQLKFLGKVTVKADNNVKYRCLRLAYMEYEDGNYKKIVDFYVTDDDNHVPVRLDMFLRFGSAKAFLIGMKGLRNPINSIVK